MSAGVSLRELGKLNPNTFDMETILTRAVNRVLTNNLYDFTSNSVEKPKVYFQGTTNQAQVRLVAEQLCRRIERRYEKKLADELEKEKGRMERKLNEIREEYRAELEQKKKDIVHEKMVMEERMREKERTLQHIMDIRTMDKEGTLDVQRKILENRQTELKMAAERLEKANDEFKKRMKAELESLRLEWEKLALKEVELNNINVDLSQARIVQEMKGKVEEIRKENEELKIRMMKIEREKAELQGKNEKLEEELRLTLFRMREKDSIGDSVLVKEILEQNAKLKEDLLRNEIRTRTGASSEMTKIKSEYGNREQAHLLKIREQEQVVELMNNRIRHLTSEKNYLKQELKEARRENYYHGSKREKEKKKKVKSAVISPSSRFSSSENLSSSESSSVSNGSVELANIKKRMYSLDHIARQLDASVEIFTMTAPNRRQQDLEHETFHGYDDFCRGIIRHSSQHSSPQKATDQVIVEEIPETRQAVIDGPRKVEKGAVDKTRAPEPVKIEPKVEEKSQPPHEEKYQSLPKEAITPSPANEPEESEFVRRLRERNEQLRNRISVTVASEEPLKETSAMQENPLFKPTSSAMADYMNLFMQPSSSQQQPTPPSTAPAEIILSEEVQLDPVSKSDDDIDW